MPSRVLAVGVVAFVCLIAVFGGELRGEVGRPADIEQRSARTPTQVNPVVGVDAATYAALFADTPTDPPVGTLVADSGFRPFPDGFSFVNYGRRMEVNQRLFGQPRPLASGARPMLASGLTPGSMRRVFGDGVCLTVAGKACDLNESAKVVRAMASSWAAAGRCFGLATVANALFTGKLSHTDVDSGAVNVLTTLNKAAQQAIMRTFIAQYFSALGSRVGSMTEAVTRLRAALSPGQIPLTLLLYGAPGGHALVPYAVFDKGGGRFDIAVYDPNLPNQPRALHIDTGANSWNYTSAPGLKTSTWTSSDAKSPTYLLFGDIDSALSKQACTFCSSARSGKTLVSFSPVLSTNSGIFERLVLTDTGGNPLDQSLYRVIPPTDQFSERFSSGPVLVVEPGVDFEVAIASETLIGVQPFVVTVLTRASTRSLKIESLETTARAKSPGTIRVGVRSRGLKLEGVPVSKGVVVATRERDSATYRFEGTSTAPHHVEALGIDSAQVRDRIVFREDDIYPSVWSLRLFSRDKAGQSTYRASDISLGAGSQLVVTYQGWSGGQGAPILWLDERSDGTLDSRIPLARS